LVVGAAGTNAPPVTVDESQIRIALGGDEARVSLRLVNAAERGLDAGITVEVLDPSGGVRAAATIVRRLERGANALAVPIRLPFAELLEAERRQFPWYRLRYRIEAVGDGAATEGLVSLSEIAPELFELRVVSSQQARGGTTFRARVRTANPVSRRPVRGVSLDAQLTFDAQPPIALRASAQTDNEGFATLDFELPRAGVDDEDEGELKVTARLGSFEQTASASVEIDDEPSVLLTTDKSLYQPGQTAHLRALAFDSDRRAMPGETVTFVVFDGENETVFRAEARTSRFGVASADWAVPENARLGDYMAKVEMGDGRYSYDWQGVQDFRVGRYDLPNFAVTAKPDRPYYLAGQRPSVEVRADYLFGRPVPNGRVRVVRQASRYWNYSEQKYEVEEEEAVEGETDAAGRFAARLDLSDEHEELAESEWQQFEDVDFAAYVTDPSTNRTEQRRFRLRLTKEPIHVYVNEGRFNQTQGMPLAFYVSTFYADGTPAQCEVSVSEVGEARTTLVDGRAEEVKDPDRPLFKVRTNRYGVAKASGPAVRAGDGRSNLPLRYVARDRAGRTGSEKEDFWLRSHYSEGWRSELRVETDRTLYRAGEPVQVRLSSNRPGAGVVVDTTMRGRVVESKALRLDGAGRAALTLPPREEYRGAVAVTATAVEPSDEGGREYMSGTRTVVFPHDGELKLDLKLGRDSYRPGEQAGVEFAVRTTDGGRAAGALGVVVFDKAVEERARTEEEFARPFGFGRAFHDFLYGRAEVAGVTRRHVERLDLSRPPPAGLEVVAEMLFNGHSGWREPAHNVESGTEFEQRAKAVFEGWQERLLKPARAALEARYTRTGFYPTDRAALDAALADAGLDLGALRDPWGRPYRTEFYFSGALDRLDVRSDGPDKRPATGDEMTVAEFSWPYFHPVGGRFDRAAFEYHARTGGFVRDLAPLRQELRRGGFDLDALRDRWGRPYDITFDVDGTHHVIRVRSFGPNGRPEPPGTPASDDFTLWVSALDYFAGPRSRIDAALARAARETGRFPHTERQLREALASSGLRLEDLRDGWGRRPYVLFSTTKSYADRVSIESRGRFDAARPLQQTEVKPVTRTIYNITVRSAGADGRPDTRDDFTLGYFTSLGAERAALDTASPGQATQPPRPVVTFSGGAGAITGTVTDPNGAIIPNAQVTASHKFQHLKFEARTDESGVYFLRNLPSGFYLLTFEAAGFVRTAIENAQVQSSNLTRADVSLQVGAVQETVTVTAEAAAGTEMLNATTAQVSEMKAGAASPLPRFSTPRLREFFPETLVWQPSLETDEEGRARLDFKLADNITTWKMSVIASTEDGRLGTAEHEFLAFQPFFAEHDPPRVLTEGDRISLPVVLRNYLERPQEVSVEMKPEEWFALSGAARQRAVVPAGQAARPVFDFRAVASVKDGRQRVTAAGAEAGDAIEKPVTVHPDGEERSETAATIFDDAGVLEVRVPGASLRGSVQSELKIYPNLAAHVVEGVEAIMQRPYGCGEQTISSAYPSVMVLDFHRRAGGASTGEASAAIRRAERYARLGYERLLSYRAPGGGFTYWGRGEPDLALTAYALRFLTDAARVIEVDGRVITETRTWLVSRQREDGSWPVRAWGNQDEARGTVLQTAFIARVLGRLGDAGHEPVSIASQNAAPVSGAKTKTPLERALEYLAARASEIEEPYLIASYALAAADAGEAEGAARAVELLRRLARDEGAGTFWAIETSTPFYGWGRAGRIETTALAVQALARAKTADAQGHTTEDAPKHDARERDAHARDAQTLARRGLLFLLANKDRYGAWLSTQATVNVLGAMLELMPAEDLGRRNAGSAPDAGERAEVFVNNRRAGDIQLPPANVLSAPLVFDLTPFVGIGDNRVEVRRAGAASPAQAQLVTSYYVPWAGRPAAVEAKSSDERKTSATNDVSDNAGHATDNTTDNAATGTNGAANNRDAAARANSGSSLRLGVTFDALSAGINQEITCRVTAERAGHAGYGMMLAEVGLPPGSDVDRASLDRAASESGWAVGRYDIRPDRVVLYLWPRAGGVNLSFRFRPRYGLDAMTAPSQLYDYYNPDARAILAPARFVIR
jgi:hypothetical protein